MKTTAIKKALSLLGGNNATARALGVKPPTVSEWVSGKRPVPIKQCAAIQRLTDGQVTCEQLAPDFDWPSIRQPSATEEHAA